jgi:hypothetical protein
MRIRSQSISSKMMDLTFLLFLSCNTFCLTQFVEGACSDATPIWQKKTTINNTAFPK